MAPRSYCCLLALAWGLAQPLGAMPRAEAGPASQGLPDDVRSWECIPGVIANNGIESFRIEIEVGQPVSNVVLTTLSHRLIGPGDPPILFRDDGAAPDRTAADGVYTAGPFHYRTSTDVAKHYLNDPASPERLDVISVGQVAIIGVDRRLDRFLVGPTIGILGDYPPDALRVAVLAPDAVITPHLINLRSSNRLTQRLLRFDSGDIAQLTRRIYSLLPDAADFFVFFSTERIESAERTNPENYRSGCHKTVRVNYTGTGREPFDQSAQFGSEGILLGVNVLDAYDRGITSLNATHELLHQWSFYGQIADALLLPDERLALDDGEFHYKARSDVASLLGGYAWPFDEGNGQFTLDCSEGMSGATRAAPLDLYLMGLIDGSEVPPIRIYDEKEKPPLFQCGQKRKEGYFTRSITIDQIQQAFKGRREPGPDGAQRHFRIAFVAESRDRLLTATELLFYETLAAHCTRLVDESAPPPRLGHNWAPITRFFGDGVTWSSRVPLPFDFEGDGDVDAADFGRFAACFNTSGQPPASPACSSADADRDGDVDGSDLAAFQACFNGAGNPPACSVFANPERSRDLDGDGDIDGSDFNIFGSCFNGTGNPIQPGCESADLNRDLQVDAADYAILAACFNGSGNPPLCR